MGMVRLLVEEVQEALRLLGSGTQKIERKVTIATGMIAAKVITMLAGNVMEAVPGLEVQVVPVRNRFFGETITVTGLITGQDLTGQLLELKKGGFDLGETLLVSANMFRTGERVFLDDMTQEEAEEALGVCITPIDSSGKDFVNALIDRDYSMGRVNDRFVYLDGKAF